MSVYLVAAGIVVCICFSAFFSASEMAYSSCNLMRLENARDDGSKRAGLAVKIVEHYDDALSRELTEKVVHANLALRAMGFKPYVAPALSSGALSLLLCLRGEWNCSSTCLGGVFMGARNRVTPTGIELERLPLPQALMDRLRATEERLRAID